MSKDKLDNDKKEIPSATDDAADVMSKYIKKRDVILCFSFSLIHSKSRALTVKSKQGISYSPQFLEM